MRRRASRTSDGASGGGVGLWHAVGFESEKRDETEYKGRGEHAEVGNGERAVWMFCV
jgi:hypothetical protein